MLTNIRQYQFNNRWTDRRDSFCVFVKFCVFVVKMQESQNTWKSKHKQKLSNQ